MMPSIAIERHIVTILSWLGRRPSHINIGGGYVVLLVVRELLYMEVIVPHMVEAGDASLKVAQQPPKVADSVRSTAEDLAAMFPDVTTSLVGLDCVSDMEVARYVGPTAATSRRILKDYVLDTEEVVNVA